MHALICEKRKKCRASKEIKKSEHPDLNQGPKDCYVTLQSSALPTELCSESYEKGHPLKHDSFSLSKVVCMRLISLALLSDVWILTRLRYNLTIGKRV
ncbi:hypothetical protein K493DRAFT_318794 [Basidiobolus meristosporus CBS 931.73]|uniref:Uncharacterized protein n=1 Tax=Basidiobolus meristosporus CBS 931.73 TaxID=1314790 RepID=A0A1Y1XU74_9FUNG|nr:hypothetical protein K493DRAFT_318793 [Basidiobolus meristosporus CBS 931.73]ORX89311.1 hypothetical protein K493DRAFT_318794 [Basidiobolus meristosporus CBS 931.73]|eukprot:ORX89310.1 hypothetical protein K493DRAFT_318793 [Basidiobolus meristosporus CBS 931.73]